MSTTPVGAAGRTVKANLKIVRPPPKDPSETIPLQFNPTELRINKSNTFADIPIPGLDVPLLQFIRGGSETLSVDVLEFPAGSVTVTASGSGPSGRSLTSNGPTRYR